MSDAFNRDNLLHDRFQQLITDNGIDLVVETGTYHGISTAAFAEMGVQVHTIESNNTYFAKANELLINYTNVQQHLGNSPTVLKELLPKLQGKKVLFFLDAHWEASCPLIDELHEIAASGIQPIIAIHDFKVPGKDFGFDLYNGQPYEWDWIKSHIEDIYDDFIHYYNTEAHGARRGVIFIEPKND